MLFATQVGMRDVALPLPVLDLALVSRAALAVGAALLVASKIPPKHRRVLGLGLAAVGVAATVPAVKGMRTGIRVSSPEPDLPSSSRRQIAADSWGAELDSFSRQHEGWLVSLSRRTTDGRIHFVAHDVPLRGVSPVSPHCPDLAVHLGNGERHFTHDIRDAVTVNLELTADGALRAMAIDSKDGSTTTIAFRSPMRPEEVDGIPLTGRA